MNYINSYIPYDIQLVIYKNLHELYMIDVRKQIIKTQDDMIFLDYFKEKVFHPFLLWNRMINYNYNNYYMKVIDKYIHRKKMIRVLMLIRNI